MSAESWLLGCLLGTLLWASPFATALAIAPQLPEPVSPKASHETSQKTSPDAAPETSQLQPLEKTFESRSVQRTYFEFAADSLPADQPAPLLIVLHGSGGRGNSIIRPWLELARQNGFVVAAPNSLNTMYWKLHDDSPEVFRDLVLAIAREHAIDTRRIYLFGQSGGAVYALTLSVLESEFFAATAIHAGSWRERREFEALRFARRKIPIEIFIGSHDQYFTVKSVQDTVAALRKAGHPAQLTIIPRHDHDYADVALKINPVAWEFVQGVSLPANAKFQEYD
jgi:poly(3-hydroxybutyrate) depolymerase